MKYVAILETENELPEVFIKHLTKGSVAVSNEKLVCCFDMKSIKPAPEPAHFDSYWGNFYYNNALKDCGVIEE